MERIDLPDYLLSAPERILKAAARLRATIGTVEIPGTRHHLDRNLDDIIRAAQAMLMSEIKKTK
jgi:hypothetical protein